MADAQTDIFLVINCGSSSLKYEVYAMPQRESLGKGQVERIGIAGGRLEQSSERGELSWEQDIPNHESAAALVGKALIDPDSGILSDINEISGVGHRVVHGGESYSESVVIDEKVIKAIEDNVELAPIHNPANLSGIRATQALLPDVPQVAVFDTSFHQTIPPSAYLYGIPRELYDQYKIRRYGFHGTSHRFVANEAIKFMKRSVDNTNVISCHLGNGASITAIQNGRSMDTSMGFTPLEGLVMGTRSGNVDPAVIFYLLERGYTAEQLNVMLNKKSGVLGLSGISSDMRDLEEAAEQGNKRAIETLDVYAHRVRNYIGAYSANLVRVDILAFTGGIGQFSVKMRERICHRLANLGIAIDDERNRQVGTNPGIISTDYSPTSIVVMPTNEELQIAIDTYELSRGVSAS
ncbi:MAG: acetate/propionate family kinase [Spirochaetales bacterium]